MSDYRVFNDNGYERTWEELYEDNVSFQKYTYKLEQENKKYKEVIDKVKEYINKYESIKAYYEYIDEDGYDEYNYEEDLKEELLNILKESGE